MSPTDLSIAFIYGFLPVLGAIALSVLPVYLFVRLGSGLRIPGQLVFLTAFGFLGGLIGYAAGASQQSIIGTVLPTLLTLITILLGYAFSKDSLSELRPIIPYCLLVLIIGSLFCLFVGGRVKRANEEYERKYSEWLLHYEKVELEVEKATQLHNLGLEVPKKAGPQ